MTTQQFTAEEIEVLREFAAKEIEARRAAAAALAAAEEQKRRDEQKQQEAWDKHFNSPGYQAMLERSRASEESVRRAKSPDLAKSEAAVRRW